MDNSPPINAQDDAASYESSSYQRQMDDANLLLESLLKSE